MVDDDDHSSHSDETTRNDQRDSRTHIVTGGGGTLQRDLDVPESYGGQRNAQRKAEEVYRGVKRLVGLSKLFTGAVAVAAVVQAATSYFQLSAMSEQNAEIRKQVVQAEAAYRQTEVVLEQMRLEQRPWLSAASDVVHLQPGIPIVVQWAIHNTGHTPAIIECIRFTGAAYNKETLDTDKLLFEHLRDAPRQAVKMIVAPGAFVSNPILEENFPAEIIEDVEDDTKVLIFFMNIEYVDLNGTQHETQACWRYNSWNNTVSQYEKHNYMN